MGLVYQVECEACGQPPEVRREVRGFVVAQAAPAGPAAPPADRPNRVAISDGYLGLRLDSGELVTVPHPVEHLTLERLGFSFKKAAREHRLFWVKFKICRNCGVICKEAQVHDPSGCLPMLISLPVFFLTLKFLAGLDWLIAINLAAVGMFVVAVIASLISWARWRRRNLELKVRNCPECGGTRFLEIKNASLRRLMCPHCHTKNVSCRHFGIS